ncbi:MAG: hypothetical protein AB8F74_12630 [Saprospiraceae bacterium]
MKPLHSDYQATLDEIKALIPESEEYKKYIEDEEEEDYQALRDRFEPMVKSLYVKVAKQHPLQLVGLEKQLLNPDFEGMFLARILGYTVLRGQITENYKYALPQEHFKEVLMAICNSSNFEYLRKRIGQTIQTGFMLSSDIWVTNLINDAVIKQVRYFLQSQKLPKYRDPRERKVGYLRYNNQFKSDFFRSAPFPTTKNGMKLYFPALRNFLQYRVSSKLNNDSLIEPVLEILKNDEFKGSYEHTVVLGIFAGFFELDDSTRDDIAKILNEVRKKHPELNEHWLQFIMESHDNSDLEVDAKSELNIAKLLDHSISDDISGYYTLMETIHTKGYVHEDTIEAVKVFYSNHEGMSVINQCVRKAILNYIREFLGGLEPEEYSSYFELSKLFPTYMGIFSNQQFNQDVKSACIKYIKRLQKKYTDKRGRDYQDIKKFVVSTFTDLEFMKKKELVEFFKTKRKKKVAAK